MGLRRLWLYWLIIGMSASIGYLLLPPSWGSNIFYNAIGLASAAMVVAGARLHRPAKARLWYLFAGGLGLWSVGDAVYGVNVHLLGNDAYPAPSDAIYLCGYPVLAAGLFVLIRGRASGRDRAGLLDASIIATGLTLVTWAFVMRHTAVDHTLPVLERLVSLAYPAGDVLLVVMLARLFTTPGARTTSYRLLVGALTSLLATDIVYAYVTTTGVYDGGLIDLGWLTSYVLWGAAALHPSMRSLSETAPDQAPRLTGRRIVLLTVTSLLAPVILVQQGLTDPANIDWKAASLGAIVLFLLVLARMWGLVSQVQDQAAQLDALAHNDALTGVPNRRAWDLELARHLANARRTGEQVVVALLDLDHFKTFNDRYGHQAGDRLLKEAAAAWRAELRSGDLLARYGGEEFGVCVTGLSTAGAAALMERVLAATPLGQTFSGGIAAWTGDEAPERLVARADAALYEAKHAGRNRVMVHNGQGVAAPTTHPLAADDVTAAAG